MQGLREFGLTENEIAVFLQLVKFGPQTVWNVAIKTGLKRTSTYDIIKNLIKRNLVLIDVSGKKNMYRAVDPNVLLEQFNLKKESISNTVKQLTQMSQITTYPTKVIRYIGISGIRTVMGLLLIDTHTIYGYGNNALSEKLLSFYPENFAQKRIENKIQLNSIIEPGTKFSAQNKEFDKYTQIRNHPLMKEQQIVYVLQNGKVVMLKLDEIDPEAIFIEDKAFYDSQKKFFDYIWKISKTAKN